MSQPHTCPRRVENGMADPNSPFRGAGELLDSWRADGSCSYCGSMNPDTFMAHLEAGDAELTPTDKTYKAYIETPNPLVGQIVVIGGESGPAFGNDGKPTKPDLTPEEIKAGRYDRKIEGPAGKMAHAKFYFQHLSDDQKRRFVELLNAKRLRFSFPGHFYVAPYFIRFGA